MIHITCIFMLKTNYPSTFGQQSTDLCNRPMHTTVGLVNVYRKLLLDVVIDIDRAWFVCCCFFNSSQLICDNVQALFVCLFFCNSSQLILRKDMKEIERKM